MIHRKHPQTDLLQRNLKTRGKFPSDLTLSREIKAIFAKVFCTFLPVSQIFASLYRRTDRQRLPRIHSKCPLIPTFLSNDDEVERRFAERARNQIIGSSSTIGFFLPFDISRAINGEQYHGKQSRHTSLSPLSSFFSRFCPIIDIVSASVLLSCVFSFFSSFTFLLSPVLSCFFYASNRLLKFMERCFRYSSCFFAFASNQAKSASKVDVVRFSHLSNFHFSSLLCFFPFSLFLFRCLCMFFSILFVVHFGIEQRALEKLPID